jgi:Bacterial Ig-like domain (group 2)
VRRCPGPQSFRVSLVRLTAATAALAASACLAVESTAPSLLRVASVPVTPASSSIPVGQTLQLNATPKDSTGDALTGRTVTWATSDSTVATVNGQGRVTAISQGSAIITATSDGKSGTAIITVFGVPLPAGSADPTLLPVASGQLPDIVAYAALNVAGQPAGFSYGDPVTGVKVWKVTSSTVPTTNSGAGHDYSDGPNEVSLGWGPNNNTHTILIGAPQSVRKYYLVDFTSGVGFSNYRRLTVQPNHDLGFSFSNLEGQPRIAYILTGSQVVRYNTATMSVENGGNFPLDLSGIGGGFGWLQHDKNDGWFAGLTNDQSTAFAWNSETGQLLTHGETWLNEPRLERDGRYIALTNTNSTFRLWDLTTNTFGPTQSDRLHYWLGHNANLRGQWVTTDVNADAPFDLDRYYPSGGEIVKTRFFSNSAGAGVHHSGNWVQSDAELGGDLDRQWSIFSGIDNNAFTATALWKQGIGVVRSDGSDARLLVHHYDINPASLDYYADPFAQLSPDGKVVIFNSNMLSSGRYDLFVAEMPLH